MYFFPGRLTLDGCFSNQEFKYNSHFLICESSNENNLKMVGVCGYSKVYVANPSRAKFPRGATPRHLTPDVWAQIGGKWVLFGPGGMETVSCYMGVF